MSMAQRRALDTARRLQSQRHGLGSPLRDSFFAATNQGKTSYPMAELLSSRSGASGGGRGGKTRILLYLSLLWVAAGGDHASHRPAAFWAALLDLNDPDGAGARAIRSNWQELEHRGFVKITPGDTSGDVPTIGALREDRSRRAYTIPTGKGGDTYRRIPEAAWQTLFHSADLTGPGLVMYLISLRTFGQARGGDITFPRNYVTTTYGISDSTRKAGLRNLVDIGVLTFEGVSRETGGTNARMRGRNIYSLHHLYVPAASFPTP